MANDYTLPVNIAIANGGTPPQVYLILQNGHDIGQAMGVMGLTYSSITYDKISLRFITKDGQAIEVQLNAY